MLAGGLRLPGWVLCVRAFACYVGCGLVCRRRIGVSGRGDRQALVEIPLGQGAGAVMGMLSSMPLLPGRALTRVGG